MITIHDSTAVYGKGDQDHNVNLSNLVPITSKNGLMFQMNEVQDQKLNITFYGCQFMDIGIKLHLAKVPEILDILTPGNRVTQLFPGMCKFYLSFVFPMSHQTVTPKPHH